MRWKTARLVLVICCGLAIALVCEFRTLPPLNAQTSQPVCAPAMFKGGYSFNVNGTIFNGNNLAGFYSVVGVLTTDGVGSVSGSDSISENGQVMTGRAFTGTYLVNPNCSGTVTLNYAGQTTPASFSIAVSDWGTQVAFLETDSGVVGAGNAMKQFTPVSPIRPYR